jgi:orotate phosphoribosyltransferase
MHYWKSNNKNFDIDNVLSFASYMNSLLVDKDKFTSRLTSESVEVDIEEIQTATLWGITSFVSVLSKCICYNINIIIKPPKSNKVRGHFELYGFNHLLKDAIHVGAISVLEGMVGELPSYGKLVFNSRPIFNVEDAKYFLNTSSIMRWINELPEYAKESDFFGHARFARIISNELATNIAEHAKLISTDFDGRKSFGTVSMRLLKMSSSEDINWLNKVFGADKYGFCKEYASEGFIEVCVNDPGIGMTSTLEPAYIKKSGCIKDNNNQTVKEYDFNRIVNIMQYAFDELGTSKSSNEIWMTEAHALSRILWLVHTYGGILDVVSCAGTTDSPNITNPGVKLTYDLYNNKLQYLGNGFGYMATSKNPSLCPWGTFIRMLVPLNRSIYKDLHPRQTILPVGVHSPWEYKRPQIILVSAEFHGINIDSTFEFQKHVENIVNNLNLKGSNRDLVIDFSEIEGWKDDYIIRLAAILLENFFNLTHNRMTFLVGLSTFAAKQIEQRIYDYVEKRISIADKDKHIDAVIDDSRNHFLIDYHRVIPACDIRGEVYWIGAPNPAVKEALNNLLDEENGCALTDLLFKSYKKSGGVPPDKKDLLPILSTCHSLFTITKHLDNIFVKPNLTRNLFKYYVSCAATTHFSKHLIETKFYKDSTTNGYHLPHSNLYRKKYIECATIFQNSELLRETGEILSRIIWNKLDKKSPDILIASTASSIMLANAMRPYFNNQPLILDAGHYFDERRKHTLSSLRGSDTVIVIQDIIDTKKSMKKILGRLTEAGVTVSGVVSMINFQDEFDEDVSVGEIEHNHEYNLWQISLFKVKTPESISADKWEFVKNMYWVEPYSLHPFLIKSMLKRQEKLLDKGGTLVDGNIRDNLQLLNKYDSLRAGHFVYENHHFSIITRMINLFEEKSDVAEKLSEKIFNMCDPSEGEPVFLVPLHSDIRYLMPRVLDKFRPETTPRVFYAVLTKELTQRPFYILPEPLIELLRNRWRDIKAGVKEKGFHVIIVDDITASMRTLETILRALILVVDKWPDNKVIEKIDVWSVINRMGRAKSTLVLGINKWHEIDFRYRCFAEYDIPVYDDEQCPLCEELNHINELQVKATPIAGKYLQAWIDRRLNELDLVVVDTPKYEMIENEAFPRGCYFYIIGSDEYKANSVASALQIFLDKADKGYPADYLIKSFIKFSEKNANHLTNNNVIKFRRYLWRWMISNLGRVTSFNSGELLLSIMKKEFDTSPSSAPDIIEVSSWRYLCGSIEKDIFKRILELAIIGYRDHYARYIQNPLDINSYACEWMYCALTLGWISLNSKKGHGTAVDLFNEQLDKLEQNSGSYQMLKTAIGYLSLDQKGANYLVECIKIASKELLNSSKPAEKISRHENLLGVRIVRIANMPPLNQLSNMELQDITKYFGNAEMLESLGNILFRSLEHSLLNEEKHQEQIIKFKSQFLKLCEILRQLNDINDLLNDPASQNLLDQSKSIAIELNDLLFNKQSEIARSIAFYNVKYRNIIEKYRKKFITENINNFIFPQYDNDHLNLSSVIAMDSELDNLIKNHTYDVITKEGNDDIRCVELKVEDDNSTDSVDLIFYTYSDNYMEHYKRMTGGHGIRHERWVLTNLGVDIMPRVDHLNKRVELVCKFQRGYI